MIRKLIRQMLAAQTLSALTVSLCLLIDSIMIARFLGEQAIAAYGLANPVLLVIGAIGSLLTAGVQVACSKSLGSGDMEETNRGYSSAVGLVLGISLSFMAVVLLLRSPLAALMGAGWEGELHDQTKDYLAGFILGAPGSMAALALVPFMQMAGQSGLLIAAVLAMTVTDVALDLLNVMVFHGGMFGMGLASSISYYAAVAVALIYFLSRKCVFRFSFRLFSWKKVRELAAGGVPTAVGMVSSVVFVYLMNQILLGAGGSAAVAAYSVLTSIGNSANCISTGVGGVSLTLSGILFHEEDRNGLKELLRLLVRYGILLGVAVGVLLAVFAPGLVGIFIPSDGVSGRMAVQGVRMFALGLIPCCILNALKSLYQGTEKVKLTEFYSVLECAVFPAAGAFVFSRFLGVTGAWLYFLCGETLTLLCMAAYAWRKAGRISLRPDPFLLLDQDFGAENGELMEREIRTVDDVTAAAKDAETFCLKTGCGARLANHIALCIEELAGNTVIHGFDGKRDYHLSVRVQHRRNQWVLRFRDDCRAFDPVSYVPRGEEDALGLRLVTSVASDIRYTYSLNLNNLVIRLKDEDKTGQKKQIRNTPGSARTA